MPNETKPISQKTSTRECEHTCFDLTQFERVDWRNVCVCVCSHSIFVQLILTWKYWRTIWAQQREKKKICEKKECEGAMKSHSESTDGRTHAHTQRKIVQYFINRSYRCDLWLGVSVVLFWYICSNAFDWHTPKPTSARRDARDSRRQKQKKKKKITEEHQRKKD